MKTTIAIIFIVWLLLTLVLVFSLVGLIILVTDSMDKKSTWMEIGSDLKNKLISN